MPKLDVIPESVVVGSCLALLNLLQIPAWRNNTGALKDKNGRMVRYGLKGSADILGIMPDGRFLAIECKRIGGKVRPEQIDFLKMITSHNGVAMIVHNPDEMMEALEEAGFKKE